MQNLFIVFSLIIVCACGAYAQEASAANGAADKAAKGAVSAKAAPLKPLTLTQEQLTRLVDAQRTLQLAQAQVEKAQIQIDSLIKGFRLEFVDLGFDLKRYEPDLRVIDQQRGQFGFLPKPEPAKEAKPDK